MLLRKWTKVQEMLYVKREDIATLYQGTSFTQTLEHEDGTVWGATEELNYEMTDLENNIVSSGDLIRSGDDLTFAFVVPETDTTTLEGEYLLLVYQTTTDDVRIKVPVAQYELTYITTKAS